MEGIDVKRQTIPLSLRSSLITTMFTPWGCYRWTRLPLVISSASKERQRQIHMVLHGLLSFGITHGILIPGCSVNNMEARIDHDRSLIAVLEGFDWRWMSTGWNSLFAKPPSWAMLPLRMASSPTLSQLKLWSPCPLQPKSKQCADSYGILITWPNSVPNLAASPNFNTTSPKRTCHYCGQQGTRKPLIQQKP